MTPRCRYMDVGDGFAERVKTPSREAALSAPNSNGSRRSCASGRRMTGTVPPESRGVLTRKGVPRPSAEFSLKLKRQALTEWAALGVGKMPPAVMEATKRSNAASQAQRELAERYGPKDSKEPAA